VVRPSARRRFDVGLGFGVVGHAGDDGRVQGTVEPPVSAAVESVAEGVARGGGYRLTPARAANAASERMRPACDQAV